MDTCETDKRLHRCCFTGHRPEKIGIPERKIKQLLTCAVDKAIKDGYTTFITGMARGVDLWAGEIVLQRKKTCTEIRLICATPYPGFEVGWKQVWRELYASVSKQADYRVAISSGYHRNCFKKRNEWMVDHSSRVIAVYNGQPGGTRNTILYDKGRGFYVNDLLRCFPEADGSVETGKILELQAIL